MSGAVGSVRLTGDEREAIENAWIIAPKGGPSGDDDPLYLAVEGIVTARLAAQEGERGGAEVAAAVEVVLERHDWRRATDLQAAVRAALTDPAGALAKHDAEVWDEGYTANRVAGSPPNPYRADRIAGDQP